MFTPTEQAIPGNTPYLDPLQMQFLTGGQMQYMPQAQFMTPSMYGAFRTMPNSIVRGQYNDAGIFNNWTIANQGAGPFDILPQYTFNTYNPAISSVQQHTYANRRLDDMHAIAGAAATTLGATFVTGALGMIPGIGLIPALALGALAPDLYSPIAERIKTTRAIQDMSTAKIFSGSDVDRSLGYGFNTRAARNIDRFIRKEAADDRVFDSGDWQEMLRLGMEFGQFDYANNAEQYKRILKNMRNSMSTMMEVMGSTDFKEIMQNLKRMRDMGATMEQYNKIAREEQAYARMTGLSYNDAIETYGKPGAVAFQQMGLNAMQGSLQSMANAANVAYMQRTGMIDPITMAKFGGVSGLTQELTAQDAKVQRSFKETFMPALMNEDMTGLREDLNLAEIVRNPTAVQQLIAETGRKLNSPEKYINYMQHKDVAYTKLSEKNDMEMFEMEMARQLGNLAGQHGMAAYDSGLMQMGMGAEEAAIKRAAYFSDEVRAAKRQTQEEAKIKEREERAAKYSPMGKFTRWLSERKNLWGEYLTGITFNEDRFRQNMNKQKDLDYRVDATPAITRGDPNKPVSKQAPNFSGTVLPDLVPNMSDKEILDLKNGVGWMDNPTDVENYLKSAPVTIFKETSKTPEEAMAYYDKSSGAMGAFQLTVDDFVNSFGKYLKDQGHGDIYNKYFANVDKDSALTRAAQELRKKKSNGKAKTLRDLPQDLRDAVENLNKAYVAASPNADFRAAYVSFIRHTIVTDRLNSYTKTNEAGRSQHKEKLDLFRSNVPVMQALESLANHGSPANFKKILDKVFGNGGAFSSIEAIQNAIKTSGGLSIAKELYRIADTIPAYHNDGNHRYEVDHKDSEYALLEKQYYGRAENYSAAYLDAFSRNATNVINAQGFNQYSQNVVLPKGTGLDDSGLSTDIRTDCSGYISAMWREFELQSKGAFKLVEPFRNAVYANGGVGSNADTLYGAHLQAAQGKDDYTINVSGRKKEDVADEAEAKIKPGDTIYLSGTKEEYVKDSNGEYVRDKKGNRIKRAHNVYHVAQAVRENGEVWLYDMRGTKAGRQKVRLRDAFTGSNPLVSFSADDTHGAITIHGLGFDKVMLHNKLLIPDIKKNTYNEADEKKAIELADSEMTKLLRTEVQGSSSEHGLGRAYGGDALNYSFIDELSKTTDAEKLADELNDSVNDGNRVTGLDIKKGLGDTGVKEKKGILRSIYEKAASLFGVDVGQYNNIEKVFSDWRIFAGPGEYIGSDTSYWKDSSWVKKSEAVWRPIVADILRAANPNLTDAELQKAVEIRMQDKAFMRTLRAYVKQHYQNDPKYKNLIEEMELRAEKAGGLITSRGINNKNIRHNTLMFNHSFANALGINFEVAWDPESKTTMETTSTTRFGGSGNTPGEIDSSLKKPFATARETFDKIASETDIAKNKDTGKETGFVTGQYYERIGDFANLYNEIANKDHSKDGQKGKIQSALMSLMKAGGASEEQSHKIIYSGLSTKDAINKWLLISTGIDATKNTAVQDYIGSTVKILENEHKDYKFDIDAFLKTRNFNKLPSDYSDSALRSNPLAEAQARVKEAFPGFEIEELHDKNKVSDVAFEQGIRILKNRNYTAAASLLENARSAGVQVSRAELFRGIQAQGGAPSTSKGVGGMAEKWQLGQPGSMPGAPGEAGTTAGAIFKPQTEEAFQKLPGVLEAVEATLKRLNNTLDNSNIPQAKKADNN